VHNFCMRSDSLRCKKQKPRIHAILPFRRNPYSARCIHFQKKRAWRCVGCVRTLGSRIGFATHVRASQVARSSSVYCRIQPKLRFLTGSHNFEADGFSALASTTIVRMSHLAAFAVKMGKSHIGRLRPVLHLAEVSCQKCLDEPETACDL
jgi:lysozyme family protein